MAKIYTSYYGKCKDLDHSKFVFCQISNSAPFPVDMKLDSVIPDWDNMVSPFKRGEISEDEYSLRYITQIIDKENQYLWKIKMILEEEDLGVDFLLLCYEKPGDFCHRHLLSDWLNYILGADIHEL